MFFALLLADVVALFLADVIAIVLMWQMLQPPGRHCACVMVGRCLANFMCACGRCYCLMFLWLMLLPFDVFYCGRYYCHHSLSWLMLLPCNMCCYDCVADVIATVADGIAI